MDSAKIDLRQELKKYFGFSAFKGMQEEIIWSIYNGHNTFVIMPTGGGKSLCYQLPALLLEGTAIVVSPLIALMKNQVDAIRGISANDGVAHVLNSSLNKGEIKQVMSDIKEGITKLLYVAPESLTKEEYISFLQTVPISFVAIDEAHCISEWGHDFRPEYRNLRSIIKRVGEVPFIGLTATATPKVQEDILKNLDMSEANIFKSSFNRPNLFYEVRPKTKNINSDILKVVNEFKGKSGVIYCLSRKKVEEITEVLKVNNFKAVPYHAGLDAKTRAKHQDMFLMEDADVVVATIAFGMGIDKPDVRFVIHHDIPKSLESYYQETGRAGRDGGEGYCLAFYSYKDIEKLEKFMASKPLAEQEVGYALLQDVMAYAETSMSRRKYLLHYFGEDFDEENGEGAMMDDNMRNPKERIEVKKQLQMLLQVIKDTNQVYKSKDVVNCMIGRASALIKSYKTDNQPYYGIGKEEDASFWMALLRQALVFGYVRKEIESYGVMKLTAQGENFIEKPHDFYITKDHDYSEEVDTNKSKTTNGGASVIDKKFIENLKDIRKKVAKKKELPPYVVFQDASIEDMAIKFPTSYEELSHVHGVSESKAKKFGSEFIEYIKKYVEENDIVRPDDLVFKSIGVNSSLKLYIIQNIDRKLGLSDIASAKGLSMDELLKEIEHIVYSGTRLNIDYWIEELLDEDQQEEIYDYFMEADNDSINEALEEFEGEYDIEELRLMRIKFISEVAN